MNIVIINGSPRGNGATATILHMMEENLLQKEDELLETVEYDYPTFHLSMDCFLCKVISGNLILKEH